MTCLVVSSCGTSLLTNKAEPAVLRMLSATAGLTTKQLSAGQRSALARRLAVVEDALATVDDGEAAEAAAEINALLALAGDKAACVPRHHLLVHSDTHQGSAVAGVLARWLDRRGESVSLCTAPGLRPSDPLVFRCALAELARQLVGELPDRRRAGWRIVFNLTGGFKPVQGFLQTLGGFLADEVVYIFEGGGRALMRLPRLPIRFEPDAVLRDHMETLRRLAAGEVVDRTRTAALPDALVLEAGDAVALSEWGHVVLAAIADHPQDRPPTIPPPAMGQR